MDDAPFEMLSSYRVGEDCKRRNSAERQSSTAAD
jgi:hypothetical protein